LLKSKNKCHFIIPILKVSVTKFQGFFDLSNFIYGRFLALQKTKILTNFEVIWVTFESKKKIEIIPSL